MREINKNVLKIQVTFTSARSPLCMTHEALTQWSSNCINCEVIVYYDIDISRNLKQKMQKFDCPAKD